MTDNLENVDQLIADQKDNPLKQYGASPKLTNASLQSIQADIRRTINELQEHQRRLEDYSNMLKKQAAQLLRDIG